ncbi:hypothetical protein SASPL_157248 [Salvia splendens]|uniref:Uncharacterized protein n=1 Tax=Salvia splendens TaxID=180675 RepID=A0A8X8VV97_SALSN|nr:hypothetical protein SASPL_157248 [Salvia splendens]
MFCLTFLILAYAKGLNVMCVCPNREENHGRSSRFNLANTLQKLARGGETTRYVVHKSRWRDVNSLDLISLSSKMLRDIRHKGLPMSGRFNKEVAAKEQILKIKEDMERKRLFESKIAARTRLALIWTHLVTTKARRLVGRPHIRPYYNAVDVGRTAIPGLIPPGDSGALEGATLDEVEFIEEWDMDEFENVSPIVGDTLTSHNGRYYADR